MREKRKEGKATGGKSDLSLYKQHDISHTIKKSQPVLHPCKDLTDTHVKQERRNQKFPCARYAIRVRGMVTSGGGGY